MAAKVYSPGRHGTRRDSDSALAAAEGSPGRRASRFTQSLGLGPNGQASQPDSVTVTVTVKVIAAAAVCDRDPPGRRRASNMIRGIEPESRVRALRLRLAAVRLRRPGLGPLGLTEKLETCPSRWHAASLRGPGLLALIPTAPVSGP